MAVCKMGCNRPVKSGYDTCCRACVKSGGGSHDASCTMGPSAAVCKMGCGRAPASGFDTCCRGCACGRGHDPTCGAGASRIPVGGPHGVVPGHVVPAGVSPAPAVMHHALAGTPGMHAAPYAAMPGLPHAAGMPPGAAMPYAAHGAHGASAHGPLSAAGAGHMLFAHALGGDGKKKKKDKKEKKLGKVGKVKKIKKLKKGGWGSGSSGSWSCGSWSGGSGGS
eukprot:TRINITY_DN97042_c0_g1_i1.p1 TRINITY_DN97042_c0_g1~~TRINITY_DN97042_c0_g1_i1.p1  ORF type:complete len:222 (+),score=28.27 TRINITY_DN97042_c0_g1_i1:61-726(+)